MKRNEIADEEAKNGSKLTTEQPESTSLKAAPGCVKRSFRDPVPSHHRTEWTSARYSETDMKNKEATEKTLPC